MGLTPRTIIVIKVPQGKKLQGYCNTQQLTSRRWRTPWQTYKHSHGTMFACLHAHTRTPLLMNHAKYQLGTCVSSL